MLSVESNSYLILLMVMIDFLVFIDNILVTAALKKYILLRIVSAVGGQQQPATGYTSDFLNNVLSNGRTIRIILIVTSRNISNHMWQSNSPSMIVYKFNCVLNV